MLHWLVLAHLLFSLHLSMNFMRALHWPFPPRLFIAANKTWVRNMDIVTPWYLPAFYLSEVQSAESSRRPSPFFFCFCQTPELIFHGEIPVLASKSFEKRFSVTNQQNCNRHSGSWSWDLHSYVIQRHLCSTGQLRTPSGCTTGFTWEWSCVSVLSGSDENKGLAGCTEGWSIIVWEAKISILIVTVKPKGL